LQLEVEKRAGRLSLLRPVGAQRRPVGAQGSTGWQKKQVAVAFVKKGLVFGFPKIWWPE
jgi:hypothetical protein